MVDLLIKNALLVDGTGAKRRPADIAISGGVVSEISESLPQKARRTIDAEGSLVTPGFIDIHTHYDGQVTWDSLLDPSASHGTTTAVMGNCGVGFAPVRKGSEDELIELMEGVEDIPGTALHEGIDWQWETFAEYMDLLERKQWSMDIGAQVPHGALRAFVMGDRGINNESATADDVSAMGREIRNAMKAGALGFSTSRIIAHTSITGEPVPGTFARPDELFAIGEAMAPFGTVYQVVPGGAVGLFGVVDPQWEEEDIKTEMEWMGSLSRECALPLTYFIIEYVEDPTAWQYAFEFSRKANQSGADLHPQVGVRPTGGIMSWAEHHIFLRRPTFARLKNLPFIVLIDELRKPEVRAAILSEPSQSTGEASRNSLYELIENNLDKVYSMSPPNYEPSTDMSIAARAKNDGMDAEAYLYDLMLQENGEMPVIYLSNYFDHCDTHLRMMKDPNSVIGLADGGAHVRLICDASCTTWLLTHWVRDRTGEKLDLEYAVKKHTADNAQLYGLGDRGVLVPGKRADLNIIDFEKLSIDPPHLVGDLPARGTRYLQRAHGYKATVVDGIVTRVNDEDTGERPGRLVRGRR